MSKIGKRPIAIPAGVEVKIEKTPEGIIVKIKGKEGELALPLLEFLTVEIKDQNIYFTAIKNHFQARANWGTMAALTRNAVKGVAKKFEKILEIEGIGFRASIEGDTLVLLVGFSHPVKFKASAGVTVTTEKNTIKISGIDCSAVGQAAAEIRSIKKPEPYQGKGIRYRGEVIRRKAGKKAAATTTA